MSYSGLETARKFLIFYSHKKDPNRLENTLQRTIQNLRDKGYIIFFGDGEYRLTERGKKAIETLNPSLFGLWSAMERIKISDIDIIKHHLSKKIG